MTPLDCETPKIKGR